jgi:hypothetical protein
MYLLKQNKKTVIAILGLTLSGLALTAGAGIASAAPARVHVVIARATRQAMDPASATAAQSPDAGAGGAAMSDFR